MTGKCCCGSKGKRKGQARGRSLTDHKKKRLKEKGPWGDSPQRNELKIELRKGDRRTGRMMEEEEKRRELTGRPLRHLRTRRTLRVVVIAKS